MEIGIYTECLSRRPTGIEVMARVLADGLVAGGQSVTCFHSSSHAHPKIPGVRHRLFGPAPPLPAYQGFGLPVLEAMASGAPVVTSANSALREVVGDAGILVDSANDDAIAHGILEILENDALARRLSLDGLERSRRFDRETMIASILDLYREVAD